MCLDVNLAWELEEPLKVYKALRLTEDGFKSPYQNAPYIIGGYYREDITDILDRAIFTKYPDMHLIVNKGIHSWTSLRKAFMRSDDSWLIFEAEIPQGSLVIEGDDDDIVSSEIIINPYFYKPIKFLGHIYYKKIKYSEEQIKPFNYYEI